MKKTVYVIGKGIMEDMENNWVGEWGSTCGRYDLEDKMWSKWDPFQRKGETDVYIDFEDAIVMVNKNETFALIIASDEGHTLTTFSNFWELETLTEKDLFSFDKVIVFTEENGFQKFPNLKGNYANIRPDIHYIEAVEFSGGE